MWVQEFNILPGQQLESTKNQEKTGDPGGEMKQNEVQGQ